MIGRTAPNLPVVTLLGDSISAGYGLRATEALPVRLEQALGGLGRRVTVLGAGVDGDTAAAGLARVDRDVPGHTDLCVVALGANDLMQARSPVAVEADLDAILARLAARGIAALLCGMRAPPWLTDYAPKFDAVFALVARRHRAPLYPFLLEGVALDPRFNLPDRIHPNAAGIEIIAKGLAPVVDQAMTDARAAAS